LGTNRLGLTVLSAAVFAAARVFGADTVSVPPTETPGELPAAASAIIGKALVGRHGEEDLRYLSDRIGGRLTGSPEAARAIAWAAERMRAIGLENVHTEKFSLRRGWTRGSASLEVTAPVRRNLRIVAYGWTGSTPAAGLEAEIAPVDLYRLDEEMARAAAWKGKVIMTVSRGEKPAGFALRAATLEGLVRKAIEAGAAGVAFAPLAGKAGGMQLPHTSALVFDGIDDIPVVSLTPEGHTAIERLLDDGEKVRVRLRVVNRVSSGPVESANVAGEIRGRERPGEVVVVGAHLDSWDLADGATDDGFGVSCVLGAAEAILASGSRPSRTIRFLLFTGEEERFLGSLAYVAEHVGELSNLVAAVVLDEGSGPIRAIHLGGRGEATAAARRFAADVRGLGDISVDDRVEAGTDTLPFTLAGAAAISFGQDSPEYDRTHHSEADTFDKVDLRMIPRDTAVLAAAAFWIADRPERIAEPWPPERTAKLLADQRLDEGLRFYGLWPFDPAARNPAAPKTAP